VADASSSLSDRAQEILRRADSQLAALKAPAPAPPEPAEAPEGEPGEHRPLGARDLGELLDTVEAGIEAARAHLVALSASLERIAEELEATAPETTLPPELESHSTMPSELAAAAAREEATDAGPEDEPAEEIVEEAPRASAAHEAARLVAIEMAVAGDTREGVGRRLRDEFGIRDPRGILDDAFGPDPGTSGRRTYGV
jgi:hypothetical protein